MLVAFAFVFSTAFVEEYSAHTSGDTGTSVARLRGKCAATVDDEPHYSATLLSVVVLSS